MTPHEEAGKILQPILDVFSGADGGVAFAKLRHSILPDLLTQVETNKQAYEFIVALERFSGACDMLLSKKFQSGACAD